MFAVIKTGGKQYKVEEGSYIIIEKLPLETENEVVFDEVLMVAESDDRISLGKPFVEGAKVYGNIDKHFRDEKKIAFKFHSKTNYKRKKGHRQHMTKVSITKILI